MKVLNEMKLSFMSRSVNEGFARGAVSAFLMQLDPTVTQLADVKTAVSEAVTNCIVHAYPEGAGMIYISAKIAEEGKFIVSVRDKGCGIADVRQAMEPLFTTGGEERAGLGFAVMQSFTDSIRVTSKPGRGTTVTMVKRLKKDE